MTSTPTGGDDWVSPPEISDDAVREETGKGWNDWRQLINESTVAGEDHTAIATFVRDTFGVDEWWAQTITVGYERITGRRLPYQRPDGTFTASKSATVAVGADRLRSMLLDDGARAALFGRTPTELLSDPSAKAIRIAVGPGTATVGLTEGSDGRTKVTIEHAKLAEFGQVEEWKAFWAGWLASLTDS